MYIPHMLPENSVKCCFEGIAERREKKGESRGTYLSIKVCNAPTVGTSSFCKEHGYALEILNLASVVGYPELQVNTALSILPGLASWEGFAVRCLPGRVKALKQKLIALAMTLEAENKQARIHGVENSRLDLTDRQEYGLVDTNDKMYVPF